MPQAMSPIAKNNRPADMNLADVFVIMVNCSETGDERRGRALIAAIPKPKCQARI